MVELKIERIVDDRVTMFLRDSNDNINEDYTVNVEFYFNDKERNRFNKQSLVLINDIKINRRNKGCMIVKGNLAMTESEEVNDFIKEIVNKIYGVRIKLEEDNGRIYFNIPKDLAIKLMDKTNSRKAMGFKEGTKVCLYKE